MAWAIITDYTSKCAQMDPQQLPKTSKFYSRRKKCDIEKTLGHPLGSPKVKLPTSKLTIFNIYRPPNSSAYSAKPSAFLDEFNSFLSVVATTPHEFVLTGDFNIQVDKPTDSFP